MLGFEIWLSVKLSFNVEGRILAFRKWLQIEMLRKNTFEPENLTREEFLHGSFLELTFVNPAWLPQF